MHAIVLDAETKSSLTAIRALGRVGVSVTAGSKRASAMGLASRYAKKTFTYPDPATDQSGFIAAIRAHSGREKPVLFCFSDATYLSVARAQTELSEQVTFLLPTLESIEIAFSKAATYTLARSLTIPTIKELERSEVTTYPVVVKPRHTISWVAGSGATGTAEMLFNEAALGAHIEALITTTGEEPVIQEFIQGSEFGVELMCKDGEVVQQFAHERLRSLSPRGGAATVKRTAAANEVTEAMQEYSKQLATALSWTGPMMVEWKLDERSGIPVLMEINGRFWGSLPLAQAAGIDFVNGYYNLATGTKSPETVSPKYITTQHLLGDCLWLLRVLFAKDPLRAALYPSRLAALFLVEWSFWVHKGDIWSWSDLAPVLQEYIDVIKRKS